MIEGRVRDHLAELLEGRDAEALNAFTVRCVWAGIEARELEATLRELLAATTPAVRAWWMAPCPCGVIGPHSHN